jgi:hypothetical protein
MKQTTLSSIFTSSKKKDTDYIHRNPKQNQAASKLDFGDSSKSGALAKNHASNSLVLKVEPSTKMSARKSKCAQPFVNHTSTVGNATKRESKSAKKSKAKQTPSKGIKNSISNENNCQSRNLKRVKVDDSRTDSENKLVYLEDSKTTATFQTHRNSNTKRAVLEKRELNIERQIKKVTFENQVNQFSKRSSKRLDKER